MPLLWTELCIESYTHVFIPSISKCELIWTEVTAYNHSDEEEVMWNEVRRYSHGHSQDTAMWGEEIQGDHHVMATTDFRDIAAGQRMPMTEHSIRLDV